MNRSLKILLIICAVAFAVRVAGITYGLPAWLVADEPPFIFGALKMMELKTVLPGLHAEDFRSVLYYPPFLSYTYLIPFGLVLGVKYLLFSGSFEAFKNFIIFDPSALFITARVISVLLGTATVGLLYYIGRRLFRSEIAGLASAVFLALAFVHANFSHWARHWVPIGFVTALTIYVLTRVDWSVSRRYITAAMLAGIGVGINYQSGLLVVLIALWAFIYDGFWTQKMWKQWWPYVTTVIFIALAAMVYLIYPAGLVLSDRNLEAHRTISGFLGGYGFHFSNLLFNDPVLLAMIAIGWVLSARRDRKFFIITFSFTILYIAIFYLLLFQVDRYILMLYPIFALIAGYGFAMLWERYRVQRWFWPATAVGILIMASMIGRFDWLVLKNDTRIRMLDIAESVISAGDKVMVLAQGVRLPATAAAIAEQRALDPESLRKVDEANVALEKQLPIHYHALNLYTVRSKEFFDGFFDYATREKYSYVILQTDLAEKRGIDMKAVPGTLINRIEGFQDPRWDIVNWFGGGDENSYDTVPPFRGGFLNLFRAPYNGPELSLYKLSYVRY